MAGLTNFKSCQQSNVDENMIQPMISPRKSRTAPSVILLSDSEVVAVDGDELKQLDQFHEEEWKLISCGNKSSRNASIEQEVSRCQTSDIMATLEDDENNGDYTRSNDRIIKYSSTNSRRDMPEHSLFDILLWLPVTTLLRFKSICKSWYALIGSSIFIAQHLDHNNCGKDILLGFPNQRDEDDGYKCCLLTGNKYEVYNNFDCGQPVENPSESLAFSSDGIICFVHSDFKEIALWNPAMKQLSPLPKSSVSFRSYVDCVFFGFGYNVKSNDYKVVRTIFRDGNRLKNLVEIYSLRADSWRTIHEDVVFPFMYLKTPISKNGTCFWISCYWISNTYCDNALVSFDFNDETFGTMSLPEGNVTFFSTLDFLCDKLAYIYGEETFENVSGPRYYEIWMLHEYGVKESWSKVWKIGPTDIPRTKHVLFPFGFSKHGDYLLLANNGNIDGGTLYLYNLGTEENEYLQFSQKFHLFVRYTESLVSIKRKNDAY